MELNPDVSDLKALGLKFWFILLLYILFYCYGMYGKDYLLKIGTDTSWFLKYLEIHVLMKQLFITSPITTLSKAFFVGGGVAGSFH